MAQLFSEVAQLFNDHPPAIAKVAQPSNDHLPAIAMQLPAVAQLAKLSQIHSHIPSGNRHSVKPPALQRSAF